MNSNLDKYKKDLGTLIKQGENLLLAMQHECGPKEFEARAKKVLKDKHAAFIKELPDFNEGYQSWYSESIVVIKLLLPDRLGDFVRLFEKPKTRKTISYDDYSVEDYLQGLILTGEGGKKKYSLRPVRLSPSLVSN